MRKLIGSVIGVFGLGAVLYCCSSGGNNCFPAGTKIRTPAGDVSVESIKVGDEVVGYDFASQREVTVHVVQTYIHHHDDVLKRLSLTKGGLLEVTPEHPLYSVTRHDWVKAGDLAVGDVLQTRDDAGVAASAQIQSSTAEHNSADVYNLQTDVTKNYFAAGILAKYY